MPPPVFGLHKDHTEHFRRSGAEALLHLGHFLLAQEAPRGRRNVTSSQQARAAAAADLKRLLDAVQSNLDQSPRSWLRQYLNDPETRKIDPRATQVLAYLAALHVFCAERSANVMRIAAACAPGGEPAELLEMRRVIACLGVEGALHVDGDWGFLAEMRLSPAFIGMLMGGAQCVPYLSDESFCSIKADKSRRSTFLGAKVTKNAETNDPKAFISDLLRGFTSLTPRHLFDELGRIGYVGQDFARRAMSLAAYRHITRLRRIYVDGVDPASLPRENILVTGPTGTGKSLLATSLFGPSGLLKLPTVVVSCPDYSETGYVGQDVETIPTRLICAAGLPLAELGIIVLDEFDKLADPGSGGRTMVSRNGVQRSLLKLLEPGTIEVPAELGGHAYRTRRVPFRTDNVLFVAAGAFSGFSKSKQRRRALGFGAENRDPPPDDNGAPCASDMDGYGIMPELYGRFAITVELDPLTPDQMRQILVNVVSRYGRELMSGNIGLAVEAGSIDLLVERALSRGTGARGLQAELACAIQDACFYAYSMDGDGRLIRVYTEAGTVKWELGRRPPSAKVTFDEIEALVETPPLDMADAVS